MKNVTKELVCAAFDSELQTRYNDAVNLAAKGLVAMQEISGLHSDDEIRSYRYGAAGVLCLAFDKFYSDVECDIDARIDEINRDADILSRV